MKLGAYTACLHDKPLDGGPARSCATSAWTAPRSTPAGSCPPPHLPIEQTPRQRSGAREDYLGLFAAAGVTLTALNCNGNPLHPDPEVRRRSTPRTSATRSRSRRCSASGGW